MTFRATVFYNPSLFAYVARGWGEEDILSGRMHTPDILHAPLVMRLPRESVGGHGEATPKPEDHARKRPPILSLSLKELKCEALRALLAAYVRDSGGRDRLSGDDACDACAVLDSSPASEQQAEVAFHQVEAGIARWAELLHIRVGASYLVHAGGQAADTRRPPSQGTERPLRAPVTSSAAPLLLVEDAEKESRRLRHTTPSAASAATTTSPTARPSAAPVLLPSAAADTTLVLSFLREDEWRAIRQDRREQQQQQQLLSHARRAADASLDGREERGSDERWEGADATPSHAHLFLCSDDRKFAEWLSAKRAALNLWWRRREADAPPPSDVSTPACHEACASSSASSADVEMEGGARQPHEGSPVATSGGTSAEEEEARRRRILAAVAARQRRQR